MISFLMNEGNSLSLLTLGAVALGAWYVERHMRVRREGFFAAVVDPQRFGFRLDAEEFVIYENMSPAQRVAWRPFLQNRHEEVNRIVNNMIEIQQAPETAAERNGHFNMLWRAGERLPIINHSWFSDEDFSYMMKRSVSNKRDEDLAKRTIDRRHQLSNKSWKLRQRKVVEGPKKKLDKLVSNCDISPFWAITIGTAVSGFFITCLAIAGDKIYNRCPEWIKVKLNYFADNVFLPCSAWFCGLVTADLVYTSLSLDCTNWITPFMSPLAVSRLGFISKGYMQYSVLIAPVWEELIKNLHPFISVVFVVKESVDQAPMCGNVFPLVMSKIFLHMMVQFVPLWFVIPFHMAFNLAMFMGLDLYLFDTKFSVPTGTILVNLKEVRAPFKEAKMMMSVRQLLRSRDILDVVDHVSNLIMVADPLYFESLSVQDVVDFFSKSTNPLDIDTLKAYWTGSSLIQQDGSTFIGRIIGVVTGVDPSIVEGSELWIRALRLKTYIFSVILGFLSSGGGGYIAPSLAEYLKYLDVTRIYFSSGVGSDIFEFLTEIKDKLMCYFACTPEERNLLVLFTQDKLARLLHDSMLICDNMNDMSFLKERYSRKSNFDAINCCIDEMKSLFKECELALLKIPISHPARGLLNNRCALLRTTRSVLETSAPQAARKEPQTLYFFGEPATLKSFASDFLIGTALDAMEVESPFDKRHIYVAPLEKQAHENGYKGHRVYKLEEVFQAAKNTTEKKNIPMFTIGAVGTNPFMFNSAALAEKGHNYLNADILGYVSNIQYPDISVDVNDAGAFWRRLHYIFEITVAPVINDVEQIPVPSGLTYTFNPMTPLPIPHFDAYVIRMLQVKVLNGLPQYNVVVDWTSLPKIAKYLHTAVSYRNKVNIARSIETDEQKDFVFCRNCGQFHPPEFVCISKVEPANPLIQLRPLDRPKPVIPPRPRGPRSREHFLNLHSDLIQQSFLPFAVKDLFFTYGIFSHTLNNVVLGGLAVFTYNKAAIANQVITTIQTTFEDYVRLIDSWKQDLVDKTRIIKTLCTLCLIGGAIYAARKVYLMMFPPHESQVGLATIGQIDEVKRINKELGTSDPEIWSKPSLKARVFSVEKVLSPSSHSDGIMCISKILRNTVRMQFKGDPNFCHGVFITANCLLTNTHFFFNAGRTGLLNIEFRSDSGRSQFIYNEQISSRNIRDGPDGISLVFFLTTSVRSIETLIIPDESSLLKNTKLTTYCETRNLISYAKGTVNTWAPNQPRIPAISAVEHGPVGEPGDCGSVVIAELAPNRFFLVGIHEGRLFDEPTQIILPVNRKCITPLLEGSAHLMVYPRENQSFSPFIRDRIRDVSSHSIGYHIPQGSMPVNMIGSLQGESNHRTPSKVEPTGVTCVLDIVKDFGKPDLINCVKPDGTYFNPHLISFGHAAQSPAQHIPKDFIDKAIDLFMTDIKFDPVKKPNVHPYPMERACSGKPESGLNGTNFQTGIGIPFDGLKELYYGLIDAKGNTVIPNDKLLADFNAMIANWKSKRSAAPMFRVALKDEVKKSGKPARQFFASPTAFLIACKMYLEPIFVLLREMEFFTSMEGINCCDPTEVEKLMCDLLGIDALPNLESEDLSEWLRSQKDTPFYKMTDSDYVKFDKVNCFAMIVVRAVIEAFIVAYPDYGTDILRGIISDLFNALCVCEGTIYEIALQVFSGCFGVVMIQSLSEAFIKTMVHMLCFKYQNGCFPEKSLRHYARLRNFGDDNIMSTPLDSHLSGANITRAYAELKISVTNANKEPGDIIEKSIMDVEFLKRKFVIHETLGPVMRIDLKSIAKSLCFWLPGKETYEKRMIASSMGAQRELVYWGRSIFDKWTANIKSDFIGLNLPTHQLVSYDTMVGQAALPGFVTW